MSAYPTCPPHVLFSPPRRGLVRYTPTEGFEALSPLADAQAPLQRVNRLPGLPIAGNDIPDDIWRLIATHIAENMKIKYMLPLMAVNRTFFEFILDLKYHEVRWDSVVEDRNIEKILRRLQHPIVSRRVRKLSVRVDVLEGLLGAQSTLKKRFSTARAFGRSNLFQQDILRLFMTAVNGMTGLIRLHVDMRYPPNNKNTFIFLKLIRTAFSNNLRSLVLRAQLSTFKLLLPIGDFKHLDELDFNFDYTLAEDCPGADEGPKEDPSAGALMETVVPFISSRRSALRSLTITSSASVDLSGFFNGLLNFAVLRRLKLNISLSEFHLSDPSSLVRFLHKNSSSLLHVAIAINPETPRQDWVRVQDLLCLMPDCLSDLETLEMPCLSLAKTLPLVGRSCKTLTRLHLSGDYLHKAEATQLIEILRPHPLGHLSFEVQVVDHALLKLLAKGMPGLCSLALVYEEDIDPMQLIPYDLLPTTRKTLAEWKLRNIDLRQVKRTSPHGWLSPFSYCSEDRAMKHISAQVPSIRTWKGVPKEWCDN
ncbi:unnamed protein product [Cyclocybe aegerita]|uniref:Uncharacterized protein n=1 Tax=Cyclocybe aegerita TaxID=1973307 RepID=A0A8S0WBP2_CYCAE|nr:unnamed protein product [Cyclocybe aegerita]